MMLLRFKMMKFIQSSTGQRGWLQIYFAERKVEHNIADIT